MIHLKFVNVHVLFPVWCYGIKPTIHLLNFITFLQEKSKKSKKPRCLKIGGKSIVWRQWKDAFHWDQSRFSLPLHERLTLSHIELDPASRMRNHLAEDVLDKKMLFMMPVRIIKVTNGFLPVNYSLINVFFFTPHFLKQGHSQNTGDKSYLFSATYLISSYS